MEDNRQGKKPELKEIEAVLQALDGFVKRGESRMKVEVSEKKEAGTVERTYHHGRCDVGSPWARGESFDVLE